MSPPPNMDFDGVLVVSPRRRRMLAHLSSERVVLLVGAGLVAAIEGTALQTHSVETAQLIGVGLPSADELAGLVPNIHHLYGSRNPAVFPACRRSILTGETLPPPSGTCLVEPLPPRPETEQRRHQGFFVSDFGSRPPQGLENWDWNLGHLGKEEID